MFTKRLEINRAASVARTVLFTAALSGSWVAVADTPAGHQLNPGVKPGDVVILRRVEAAPINRVKRHGGPVTSWVNARDTVIDAQQRINGINAVSLTDERAAGVRSSVQGSMGSLHRTLGTDSRVVNGEALGSTNRAASSLGGGGTGGGGVASRVTSVTSGIAGSIGQALSPLTGRD